MDVAIAFCALLSAFRLSHFGAAPHRTVWNGHFLNKKLAQL